MNSDWMKVLIPVLLLSTGTLFWYIFIQVETIKENTLSEEYLNLRFKHGTEIIQDHEDRIRVLESKNKGVK